MEILAKSGDQVLLTKITDDKFNGNHPNDIYVGYEKKGELIGDVTLGYSVNVINPHRYFCTSCVTEVINETTFKTKNSTYKIEIINENYKA